MGGRLAIVVPSAESEYEVAWAVMQNSWAAEPLMNDPLPFGDLEDVKPHDAGTPPRTTADLPLFRGSLGAVHDRMNFSAIAHAGSKRSRTITFFALLEILR